MHLIHCDRKLPLLGQLFEQIRLLPEIGLVAHQDDGDAAAEVLHLARPLALNVGQGVGSENNLGISSLNTLDFFMVGQSVVVQREMVGRKLIKL